MSGVLFSGDRGGECWRGGSLPDDSSSLCSYERSRGVSGANQLLNVLRQGALLLRCQPREHHGAHEAWHTTRHKDGEFWEETDLSLCSVFLTPALILCCFVPSKTDTFIPSRRENDIKNTFLRQIKVFLIISASLRLPSCSSTNTS